MAFEIFTLAFNASSSPDVLVMPSSSSDSTAIAALIVSIITACATAIALSDENDLTNIDNELADT